MSYNELSSRRVDGFLCRRWKELFFHTDNNR